MSPARRQRSLTQLEAAAISIGSAVGPRLLSGRSTTVHSVYKGAVNIVTHDGIVSLVPPKAGRSPNSIVLHEADILSLRGLVPGDPVDFEGQTLTLGKGFRVTFRRAETYSEPPVPRERAVPSESVTQNLVAARGSLVVSGRFEGLGPLIFDYGVGSSPESCILNEVSRRASRSFKSLLAGLRSGDRRLTEDSLEGLLGLGPGLTPSGDDLVLGLLAALKVGEAFRARPAGSDMLSQCVAKLAPQRTNLLSSDILTMGSEGGFNEKVRRALDSIHSRGPCEVSRDVEDLVSLGATSGTDIAAGVIIGTGEVLVARRRDHLA